MDYGGTRDGTPLENEVLCTAKSTTLEEAPEVLGQSPRNNKALLFDFVIQPFASQGIMEQQQLP